MMRTYEELYQYVSLDKIYDSQNHVLLKKKIAFLATLWAHVFPCIHVPQISDANWKAVQIWEKLIF